MYAALYHFDPVTFTETSEECGFKARSGSQRKEEAVMGFMCHSYFQRKLRPNTIESYLSAIAHWFMVGGRSTRFMLSTNVGNIRLGLRNMSAAMDERSGGAFRLPFTIDMVRLAQSHILCKGRATHVAIYAALLTAFMMLLRASEYVPTEGNKHFIRACDVIFFVQGRMGHVGADTIGQYTLQQVRSVRIVIPSAKNDPTGVGKMRNFTRMAGDQDDDMCAVHYRWCNLAKPENKNPYFALGTGWRLSVADMVTTMRAVAHRMRVNPHTISAHSLRYGGASALLAAGVETDLIKCWGSWKSNAFMKYIRITASVSHRIQQDLANSDLVLSADDVQKLVREIR